MTGAEYVALRVALDRVEKADEPTYPAELLAQSRSAHNAYAHLEATVRRLIQKKVPRCSSKRQRQ